MELKEIEQILDPIPMTGAIQRQIMQAIQAYGNNCYNQALTSVYARWINNECLLTERDFAELKKQ